MEEQISVIVQVGVELMVDKEKWPEDWSLEKEIAHQMTFDDALGWEISAVRVVGP